MNMKKTSVFFFLALLALAYGQDTKTIPTDTENASNSGDLPAKNIESDTPATMPSKAPPSEFLASASANGTKLPPTQTVEIDQPKTTVAGTKTVPTEFLTATANNAATPATPANGASTGAVSGSMNAGNNTTESSSATKVAGTFVASLVAFIMALY